VKRRAFVIVLDACGAGELPDSADYGDAGANTLGHVAEASGGLDVPVMQRLGLGSALPLAGCPPAAAPVVHGRLHPLGPGKDTISGHWELMGAITPVALRTYPDGFPEEVIDQLRDATGRGVLCNRPYSGTAVIDDFGEQHLRTGDLIVYTSADSVLQIAAHEDEVPAAELYAACRAAREIMRGEHAVGRVIARPFADDPAGGFRRTPHRRDFALAPLSRSYLDALDDAGVPVHGVGKVAQLFTGFGFAGVHPGATNAAALASTSALLEELDTGFVFTNLIETDEVYGHRKDVEGFHAALRRIDAEVAIWLGLLRDGDLLVLTADHGCDPRSPHSDHTREHAPLLAVFAGHDGRRHDGALADVGASVLRWLAGRDAPGLPGVAFT
jgi:phosphopentomutase